MKKSIFLLLCVFGMKEVFSKAYSPLQMFNLATKDVDDSNKGAAKATIDAILNANEGLYKGGVKTKYDNLYGEFKKIESKGGESVWSKDLANATNATKVKALATQGGEDSWGYKTAQLLSKGSNADKEAAKELSDVFAKAAQGKL